jgi:hypothetical protein
VNALRNGCFWVPPTWSASGFVVRFDASVLLLEAVAHIEPARGGVSCPKTAPMRHSGLERRDLGRLLLAGNYHHLPRSLRPSRSTAPARIHRVRRPLVPVSIHPEPTSARSRPCRSSRSRLIQRISDAGHWRPGLKGTRPGSGGSGAGYPQDRRRARTGASTNPAGAVVRAGTPSVRGVQPGGRHRRDAGHDCRRRHRKVHRHTSDRLPTHGCGPSPTLYRVR